jgi:hypothetical protein
MKGTPTMKVIKCYFQSCKETVEVEVVDDAPQARGSSTVLAAGAVFGHQQYQRVPFLPHDDQKLSGRPWTCAFHDAMVGATLGLSEHEEKQRQMLVAQLRIGRMTKREHGWYEQAAAVPVKPYSVREDNGDLRTTTVKWWTQEQMIAALNGEPGPVVVGAPIGRPATGEYKVFVKDPPPGVVPDADEDSDGESA